MPSQAEITAEEAGTALSNLTLRTVADGVLRAQVGQRLHPRPRGRIETAASACARRRGSEGRVTLRRQNRERIMRPTTILLAVAGLAAASPAAAAPSLCTAGELPVFSCAMASGRIASLCASADLSETTGTLRYRFGRPGKVELVHPQGDIPPRAAFRAGIIGAGGGDFIRFSRGDTTYTIEHAEGPRSGSYAGVTVHRGPRRVADLRCKGTPYEALGTQGLAPVYRAKLPGERYSLE